MAISERVVQHHAKRNREDIMKILDRFLLRQFFRVFIMVFISLLGIFVIADFVGNIDEFNDRGDEGSTLGSVLAAYYGARVPWFFDLASRHVAVLSAVMTVAWLKKGNELTALMATGVSRWRVARPLVIACGLIAILAAANRELGVPEFRNELCRSARDLIRNRPENITPRYDAETDILIDGQSVFQYDRRIEEPKFRLPLEWPNVGRTLTGQEAHFMDAVGDRPSGYLMTPRNIPIPASQIPSLVAEGQPMALTPRDHPDWIPEGQILVVSKLGPQQLTRGRKWRKYTATVPLVEGLRSGRFDADADVRVLVHSRFVQPLLDITLLFLGLPLVMDGSTKVVWSATKSLFALSAFAIVVLACHGMGMQGLLSPAMAAWAPAFVLVPAAFLMSGVLRT